jgi:ribosomal protein S21
MPVTVLLHEDESVEQALSRLRRKIHNELARPWYKRRYGCHEKPAELRRKREKMQRLQIRAGSGLWLKVELAAQFRRTAPLAAGQ